MGDKLMVFKLSILGNLSTADSTESFQKAIELYRLIFGSITSNLRLHKLFF